MLDFNTAEPRKAMPTSDFLQRHAWAGTVAKLPTANDSQAPDLRQTNEPAAPAMEGERRSKFVVEDFDEVEPSNAPWLVKGVWPATGVAFIAGPSMAGKSFFALDAAAKVCKGAPVIGKKATQCGVIYLASEAPAGVRARIKGLRQTVGPLGGRFKMIGQAANLTEPDDVDDLRSTLVAEAAVMSERGVRLGLLVIDTLSTSIPGADENSAKDMSPVLTRLRSMAEGLALLVLVVAHTSKADTTNVRGWSGLKNDADGLILLEKDHASDTRLGRIDKVKDGEAGAEFAFKLDPVTIGIDADGDEVTTCIVVEADAPAAAPRGRKPTKASGDAELILRVFHQLPAEAFAAVFAPGAEGARGVRFEVIREKAYEIGFGPSPPSADEFSDQKQRAAAMQKWRDGRRKAFDRARDYLIQNRMLRQHGDVVWAVARPNERPR